MSRFIKLNYSETWYPTGKCVYVDVEKIQCIESDISSPDTRVFFNINNKDYILVKESINEILDMV